VKGWKKWSESWGFSEIFVDFELVFFHGRLGLKGKTMDFVAGS
jgi:hypothetical protein